MSTLTERNSVQEQCVNHYSGHPNTWILTYWVDVAVMLSWSWFRFHQRTKISEKKANAAHIISHGLEHFISLFICTSTVLKQTFLPLPRGFYDTLFNIKCFVEQELNMCKPTNVEQLITFSIVFIIKLVLLVWFSVAHATSGMLVDKNRIIFLHWELLFIQENSAKKYLLFCPPTWPPIHVDKK